LTLKVIDLSAYHLDVYREFGPKIVESYKRLQDLVFSEGALSQKFKVLIAMAIDLEHRELHGAAALSRRAPRLGATREVIEALIISYCIGSNRAIFLRTGPAKPPQTRRETLAPFTSSSKTGF
jgi:alkylhydroperoxidase/carboxymuconolactone decarboxylase family protein YurZ